MGRVALVWVVGGVFGGSGGSAFGSAGSEGEGFGAFGRKRSRWNCPGDILFSFLLLVVSGNAFSNTPK